MPSLFPELFAWGFFVPTLFRLLLAGYLFSYGLRVYRNRSSEAKNSHEAAAYRIFGFLLVALAVFLLAGYMVQVAAAITVSLGILALWFHERHSPDAPQTRAFYIFATAMALSLIVLGPGAFAIDLPL